MAFGDSGILDNFNRSNGGVGANWTNGVYGGGGVLLISSNAAYGDSGYADAWWSAASFSADQEVFATLPSGIPDGSGIYTHLRLASPGNGSAVDGYFLLIERAGSTYTWTIYRTDNGSDTALSGSGSSQAISSGDAFGLRVVGSTLSAWYRASGGSWSQLFTRTDSTYSAGGYISAGVVTSSITFDDFGGGDINDGPAAEIEQEGFRWRNDDGSETGATWAAAQDTDITADASAARRLRLLLNATGDPAASAFRLESRPAAGSWAAVPVAATASVAWGAAGTAGSGTTSATPAFPTGISAATSKIFCVVTGRGNTADTEPTMPSGWTRLGGIEGGTGTWGVDTGTRRVDIFQLDTVTGSESGTVTVSLSGTTNNTLRATIFRVEVPSGWGIDVDLSTATDTSNDTSLSFTGGTNLEWAENDLLVYGIGQNIDTGTHSSQSLSASGASFTRTNRASTAVTNGNDHRHVIESATVDSGSSGSSAPTFSATLSASGSGAALFARMRAVPPAFQVVASANITAGGEATTAQLAAPSGKTTSDFVTGRMWDNENGTDTIDITADDYTEVEWCIQPSSSAVNGTTYEFRVTIAGTPLTTYTVTPEWTVSSVQTVSPSGGSSDEAFGTAVVQPGAVSVAPSGAASDEAFGAHVITAAGGAQGLAPAGVSSDEAFGTAALQPGAVVVDASSIATDEAFGTPVLAAVATLAPSSASSGEAFGTPTLVAAGPAQTIGLGGHAIPPRGEDASGGIRFYGINTGDVGRIAIPRDVAGVGTPVDVGAGDFTVEFWIRARYADNATSVTDVRYSNIIFDGDAWDQVYGQCIGVTRSSGTLRVIYGQADTGLTWLGIVGTTNVGDDAWHHVAVVRQYSTGTVRIYVDGVDNGSRTYTASRDLSYPDGSSVGEGQRNEYWVIGTEKHDVGEAFNGYFDELRISDIRRYTAAFTPPARRFEPDSNAVGLYHFDEGAGTTARDAATVAGAPTHGTLLVGGTPQAPQWVISQAPLADGAKVGSPAVAAGGLALAPSGVATGEAFGTAAVQPGAVSLACSGIGSDEAVGTPVVAVGAVSVVPTGASSDEAFGTPAITTAVAIVGSGAASEEALGALAVVPGAVTIAVTSISSEEAFGVPMVDAAGVVTLAPAGIASEEAPGVPQIVPGAVAVVVVGITTDEAFGASVVAAGAVTVATSGASSSEAFGAPVVTFGGVTVGGTGITTDEAFGASTVLPGAVTIAASGIVSTEAFGTPVVTAPSGDAVAPSGVPTDEAFGSAAVQPGAVAIAALGIASGEAFGTPVVAEQALVVVVVGLASDEVVGTPVIQVGAVSIAGAGIAGGEMFGVPVITYGNVPEPIQPSRGWGLGGRRGPRVGARTGIRNTGLRRR